MGLGPLLYLHEVARHGLILYELRLLNLLVLVHGHLAVATSTFDYILALLALHPEGADARVWSLSFRHTVVNVCLETRNNDLKVTNTVHVSHVLRVGNVRSCNAIWHCDRPRDLRLFSLRLNGCLLSSRLRTWLHFLNFWLRLLLKGYRLLLLLLVRPYRVYLVRSRRNQTCCLLAGHGGWSIRIDDGS